MRPHSPRLRQSARPTPGLREDVPTRPGPCILNPHARLCSGETANTRPPRGALLAWRGAPWEPSDQLQDSFFVSSVLLTDLNSSPARTTSCSNGSWRRKEMRSPLRVGARQGGMPEPKAELFPIIRPPGLRAPPPGEFQGNSCRVLKPYGGPVPWLRELEISNNHPSGDKRSRSTAEEAQELVPDHLLVSGTAGLEPRCERCSQPVRRTQRQNSHPDPSLASSYGADKPQGPSSKPAAWAPQGRWVVTLWF